MPEIGSSEPTLGLKLRLLAMAQTTTPGKGDGISRSHECWVCGSPDTRLYKRKSITRELIPSDLKITDANYGNTLELHRCARCGFVFAEGSELGRLLSLYEQLEDEGYEQSQVSRQLQMTWLADLTLQHKPDARTALEVGAGTGLLVQTLRARGLSTFGLEPSRSLVEVARTRGVELLSGTFGHPDLEGRKFDLVFLIDVIEHVVNPRVLLESAAKALTPGGVVVVVTPDHASVARRVLRHKWWHFRLAHVCYFERRSFAELCKRCGLTLERAVRARWFFPVTYVLERLQQYVPLPLGRWVQESRARSFFDQQVVELNLFDSWVFMCRSKS